LFCEQDIANEAPSLIQVLSIKLLDEVIVRPTNHILQHIETQNEEY